MSNFKVGDKVRVKGNLKNGCMGCPIDKMGIITKEQFINGWCNERKNSIIIKFESRDLTSCVWRINDDADIEIVNDVSSTQVREIKREAKIGEYIKIVDGSGCSSTKVGDIGAVTDIWSGSIRGGVDYKTLDNVYGSGYHERYVVLENYTPQEKTYNQTEVDELIQAEKERIYEELKKLFEK